MGGDVDLGLSTYPGRKDMRRLLIALIASAAILGVGAVSRAEAGAAMPVRTETVYLSLSGLT